MHETPNITAEKRERVGTRYARRLRNSGRLPAVIYGHGEGAVAVSFDEKEALDLLHDGHHVLNVSMGNGDSQTCLVKDLQFGFLGDNVIHVDLARVDLDEEVHVNIPIHFLGEPEAAKEPGAILAHDITSLEVICKVSAIPDEIAVDISNLEQSITVEELDLPPGVRTEVDPATPVAHIGFVAEVEEVGEEADIELGEEEPEVITEGRADEETEGEEGEEEKESE